MATGEPAAKSGTLRDQAAIAFFYQCFNERRLDQAAGLFEAGAILEHVPLRRQQRGPEGFLQFANMWVRAFPDAALTIERTVPRNDTTYEVEILAAGTHLGDFDMGGCGVFKPTGARATLRLRQLLEMHDGRIAYSSLSFDLQDIVQQLVTVDTARLLEHVERIQHMGEKLKAMATADEGERRTLIERIGAELDAARRIIRPQFSR